MTIFLNIYIFVYLLTLIHVQFLLYDYNYSTKSITYLTFFINKFCKFKSLFTLLMLSLTGLPPFFLFFVKTNILISILSKNSVINILLIFIIFFLNMLFYVQVFYNKNTNYTIKIQKNNKQKNVNFILYYRIIFLLVFLFFSIFFFIDLFFILKLIYKWQH